MKPSRRDLGRILPAVAAAATAAAQEKETQTLPSKAFPYGDLPVKINGLNKSRAVLKGQTHSAFDIELHMTELAAGQAPHPPHHHVHEELVMLHQGSLEATIRGETTVVTAGSVLYLASNDEHGWRNPGPGPAQYFVIALGKDA
ncbi:MAG TPA: cupin domain-containing protein [Bryobacteraceae bacterium]|nr:cupin domain-containing protein [Bryobacteraceae bacterium]